MAQNIFFELAIVIAIAALTSMLMRALRQPLIIGYIITGIIVGPFVLNLVQYSDTLAAFSQIGIALLLFIVGLNLDINTLREVGSVSLVTGIGQVLFTSFIGYFIAIFLGFSPISSLYISIALTFSSTIIIVKLLSDKQDLDSLYGKIAIGFLLVQDLIAVLILMFLASGVRNDLVIALIATTTAKVTAIILLLFFFSRQLLPKILNFIAKSQELLFLFGISWVFILALILNSIGFSIEIGALLAGISLASSPFHFEIASKLKPLRDFFIILFFVMLGSQMIFSASFEAFAQVAVFSVFILIGNPLIVMFIMGLMGYTKRTGFMAGLTVAQISEFSLILVVLGVNLGHLSQEVVSMVTVVGLVTIAGSTYMILYSDRLYKIFSKYLNIFESKNIIKSHDASKRDNFEIILFGYNRIGYSLVRSLKKLKKKFLIIDYNPEIIDLLNRFGVPYKYGDASDSELLEELNLHNVNMVISTIPHLETNVLLIQKAKAANNNSIAIVTSHNIDDAFKMYEAGADYVILPHFLGGEHASAMVEKFGTNIGKFVKEKIRHLDELSQRKKFGHEHPQHHR